MKRFVQIIGEDGKKLPPNPDSPLPTDAGQQIGWIVVDRFDMRVLDAQLWDLVKLHEVMEKVRKEGASDVSLAGLLLDVGADAKEAVYKAVMDALFKKQPKKRRAAKEKR